MINTSKHTVLIHVSAITGRCTARKALLRMIFLLSAFSNVTNCDLSLRYRPTRRMSGLSPDSTSETHPSVNSNPLDVLKPRVLDWLSHLDLSSRVLFKEEDFVSGGGYGDVFRGHIVLSDNKRVKVAIKRLRFYMREDILSVSGPHYPTFLTSSFPERIL